VHALAPPLLRLHTATRGSALRYTQLHYGSYGYVAPYTWLVVVPQHTLRRAPHCTVAHTVAFYVYGSLPLRARWFWFLCAVAPHTLRWLQCSLQHTGCTHARSLFYTRLADTALRTHALVHLVRRYALYGYTRSRTRLYTHSAFPSGSLVGSHTLLYTTPRLTPYTFYHCVACGFTTHFKPHGLRLCSLFVMPPPITHTWLCTRCWVWFNFGSGWITHTHRSCGFTHTRTVCGLRLRLHAPYCGSALALHATHTLHVHAVGYTFYGCTH